MNALVFSCPVCNRIDLRTDFWPSGNAPWCSGRDHVDIEHPRQQMIYEGLTELRIGSYGHPR